MLAHGTSWQREVNRSALDVSGLVENPYFKESYFKESVSITPATLSRALPCSVLSGRGKHG